MLLSEYELNNNYCKQRSLAIDCSQRKVFIKKSSLSREKRGDDVRTCVYLQEHVSALMDYTCIYAGSCVDRSLRSGMDTRAFVLTTGQKQERTCDMHASS
jgi:hypothetical protein